MSQTPEVPKKRARSAKSTASAGVAANKASASKASTTKASASKTSTTKANATKATSSKTKTTTPRTRKAKGDSMTSVTPELRYRMISEAAFYIAESHGFDPSRSMDDWLEAEAMIDARLGGGLTH